MDEKQWFRNVCEKNSLHLEDHHLGLLEQYVSLLISWNKKINLVSRREGQNIWRRHIVGSLAILFQHQLQPDTRILDLGTGGGLPGIPLAIVLPQTKFTLIDSVQKKIRAVDDILQNLGLENVSTLCARAEEIGRKSPLRNSFDYVIARAVAPVLDLLKWSKPFLKRSDDGGKSNDSSSLARFPLMPGSLLMLKGGELSEEIDSAKKKLKNVQIEIHPLLIDGLDQDELSDKKLLIANYS